MPIKKKNVLAVPNLLIHVLMYEPICMHCKYYVIHILYWFWEVHKQHFGKRLQKFRGLTIFYNRNIWNGFHLVTFWVVWRIFAVISNILLAGVDSSKKSTPIRLGVTPIFPTHSDSLLKTNRKSLNLTKNWFPYIAHTYINTSYSHRKWQH